MTITICHNKPPDRKLGWSVDDIMPRRDGPENLRILKRRQLGIQPLKDVIGFSTIEACGRVLQISTDRDIKHHKIHSVLGWGQHSMVSLDF